MSSRRSFFKSLTGCIAAAAMTTLGFKEEIPKFKAVLESGVNPAYLTTEYECTYLFNAEASKRLIEDMNAFPKRYNINHGKWVEVPLYKESQS